MNFSRSRQRSTVLPVGREPQHPLEDVTRLAEAAPRQLQAGLRAHGFQRNVVVACGPAEFSGLGEGRARCLKVVGGSVRLCQANGGEDAQARVVVGQKRERSPGKRDGAVRLSLQAGSPGLDGCDASEEELTEGLVHARPRVKVAAFSPDA